MFNILQTSAPQTRIFHYSTRDIFLCFLLQPLLRIKISYAKFEVSEYVTLSLGVSIIIPSHNLAQKKLIATVARIRYLL